MNGKRIVIWFASYSAFLFLLVYAFLRGLLSPRALGLVGLVSMISFGFVLTLLFRRGSEEQSLTVVSPGAPLDAVARKKRLRLIRNCKVLVLVLVFCLFNALRQFEKEPVTVLVGVTVNLCMTAALIYFIVKLQRSLR